MPNLLEVFGEKPKDKGNFQKTLFNFLMEIPIYPFDETYEVRNNKKELIYTITKKGMSMAMFNSLVKQVDELHKKQKKDADKLGKK